MSSLLKKESINVFSHGGGDDTTLLLNLILEKDKRLKDYWDIDLVVFADPQMEMQYTYDYLKNHTIPALERAHIPFRHLYHPDGGLYERMFAKNMVMMGWANPLCSSSSKRDLIRSCYRELFGIENQSGNKYLSHSFIEINEIMGMHAGEPKRVENFNKGNQPKYLKRSAPLYEAGLEKKHYDHEFKILKKPRPGSSHCDGCPNLGINGYREILTNRPQQFKRLVALEENAKLGDWSKGNPTSIPDFELKELYSWKKWSKKKFDEFENWFELQCNAEGGFCNR